MTEEQRQKILLYIQELTERQQKMEALKAALQKKLDENLQIVKSN